MIQDYHPPENDDATPEEIAAEISANHHRIDSQLHQLAQRVTPQSLVQNAIVKLSGHSFDEATDELSHFYAKTRAFERKRPLGTALLALGIAVLFVESSKSKRNSGAKATAPGAAPGIKYQEATRRQESNETQPANTNPLSS